MKLKDIEVVSIDDCPLREVCFALNCGDPDRCVLANLDDKTMEMNVEDYIIKGIKSIEQEEIAIDKEKALKKKRSESAKKASFTCFMIGIDDEVLTAKHAVERAKRTLEFVSFLSNFSGAYAFTNGMVNGTSIDDKSNTGKKTPVEEADESLELACANLKSAKKNALKRIKEERKK